jgi:hypothetical protein
MAKVEPKEEELCTWLRDQILTEREAVQMLQYLAQDARYRRFWNVQNVLRSRWFPTSGGHVTTAEAKEQGCIPDELLEDAVFRAWLGLVEKEQPVPCIPEPASSPPDARTVLEGLHEWWQTNRERAIGEYECALYPRGAPPKLSGRFSANESGDRRGWLTLLLLGSLHKMGRAQLEQHREFLERCEARGWMDVFADPRLNAARWIEVLEQTLDESTYQEYYQWVKWFVETFQFARWLREYVELLLTLNRRNGPISFDDIVAPRTSAHLSGGGPDAPPLTRTLGIGVCFVLRELVRHGLVQQPAIHRYCFVPEKRVRCLLWRHLGAQSMENIPPHEQSAKIYEFLKEHLGREKATFDGSFDLPLGRLARDSDLQTKLFGSPVGTSEWEREE